MTTCSSGIEDAVRDAATFTNNRDRPLDGEVASKFLTAAPWQDKVKRLLSSEHSRSTGHCWKPGQAQRVSTIARSF